MTYPGPGCLRRLRVVGGNEWFRGEVDFGGYARGGGQAGRGHLNSPTPPFLTISRFILQEQTIPNPHVNCFQFPVLFHGPAEILS